LVYDNELLSFNGYLYKKEIMKKRNMKEDRYFDDMETAFGVDHKHDNMTDEEKAQFDEMEEVGIEGKGVLKDKHPADSKLTKNQKESGKDAIDYYKSIIDKMAKNQKTNVDNPNATRIGESVTNEGHLGTAMSIGVGMAVGAVHAFSVGQEYVDLFQDAYGEQKEVRVGDVYEGKIIDVTEHGKRFTNPYTGEEGGSPQQGFRVEVLTNEGDTIVFYEMTLERNSLPQDGTTVSIEIIEHPDTEYLSPEMFSGQQYDVDMRENKKYGNALTRLEEEFEEPKVNIEDDEREMYYGTGMEGLRYDTDGTERQETLDKRMDELNDDEDDSTYNRLKKDGQNYKDYKYGKEKYNKAEDEYQETPRVRVTKGVNHESTKKNKDVIKEIFGFGVPKEVKEFLDQNGVPPKGTVLYALSQLSSNSGESVKNKMPITKTLMPILANEFKGSKDGNYPITMNKFEYVIGKTIKWKDSQWNGESFEEEKSGEEDTTKEKLKAFIDELKNLSGGKQGEINEKIEIIDKTKNETKMVYKDVIEENTFKAKGKLVSEEQVLKLANKVPSRVKIDETVFAITDGDNSYRLIWEGEEAIITHSKNKEMVSESISDVKRLYSFNTNDSISTKKTITESGEDSFKRMFNQMRDSDGLVDKTDDK
jgi:hypothetical protein